MASVVGKRSIVWAERSEFPKGLFVPRILPTLEAVAQTVGNAALDSFGDCLDAVSDWADAQNLAPITLQMPNAVRYSYIRDDELNQTWPTLVVQTVGPRRDDPGVVGGSLSQVGLVGRWRGTLWLQYWVADSDPERLELALQRYQAALFLLVANTEPMAKGVLDPNSVQLGASPQVVESLNLRVAQLSCDVVLGV